MKDATQKYLAIARIALGFIFLWAFFDKVFGLGFSTESSAAVVNGGSATMGYLKFASSGVFAAFYQNIAGNQVVEWLFLLGLLGTGIAFLLGLFMRPAIWAASAMMILMWSTNLPPANNPLIDNHIIYLLTIIAVGSSRAGDVYSVKGWSKDKPQNGVLN